MVWVVSLRPDLVVHISGRVERLLVLHRLLHWDEHRVAADVLLIHDVLAILDCTRPPHDDLRNLALRVHRCLHTLRLLYVLHAQVEIFFGRCRIVVWQLLAWNSDSGSSFLAIPVAWHGRFDPSLLIEVGARVVRILVNACLVDGWLRNHLMILQRSHLVQVVILNLVVGMILSLVQLNVRDRVCISDHGRRCRIQIRVALLKLLELLKLLFSRQREHINH